MKRSVFIVIQLIFMASYLLAQETSTFTDPRDGKTYKTVKINDQWWMAENLDYETSESWKLQNAPFGRVYKYEVATNVCPQGWHLPSLDEWIEATGGELDGDKESGEIITDVGRLLINDKKFYAFPQDKSRAKRFNSTGLSLIPGGYYIISTGKFRPYEYGEVDLSGYYWTSSTYNDYGSLRPVRVGFKLSNLKSLDVKAVWPSEYAFYVRCVKNK